MEDDDYLIYFKNDNGEEIVRIKVDGTVVASKVGAFPHAAKLFYETLQIEGKTLHEKIKTLEEKLRNRDVMICSLIDAIEHLDEETRIWREYTEEELIEIIDAELKRRLGVRSLGSSDAPGQ